MITFEDTRTLIPGSTLLQHTGFNEHGDVVSTVEWQVTKVHPNSIDVVCPLAVGRYQHIRFNRSDFPLQYWSIDDPEVRIALDELNGALKAADAPFRCAILGKGEKYRVRNYGRDIDGHTIDICTHPYSRQGILRYLRLVTFHVRNGVA